MPHYEFFCQECKKLFDKILSLVDYEEGEVLCPHCGSKKVEQWSAFSASTAKKGDKIVPILKKQPGFVDEIVLVSDADSNRVLALSFWKTSEDAERYQREQYNSVRATLQSLLEAEPVVRTFEVHTSTGHKITAGKAA
ncbi:MAG: hypothetical protein DMG86_04220 [Acidobacteria bacterium]|jgi:putative FmdB family regulatory protein|nr:MAG: hypothetical protein DMG86_04220 [Acidobacteriota bacterium]PYX03411.1 MAG: hypothetical protein DMG85_19800 [Acidobacteriota bacterium]PYX14731.1 MAG: hypothetical protein DMG84_14150 [Acidobacteriota bacterium]